MAGHLGSGISGVPGVHFAEASYQRLARPFQVRPGGVNVCRVASPEAGIAALQGKLQRCQWPRPLAKFSRGGGLVAARVVILTRNGAGNWRRKPDTRTFRNACDALAWSIERLKLSDRLEVQLLRDGLASLSG
jgi:hypothetical protein